MGIMTVQGQNQQKIPPLYPLAPKNQATFLNHKEEKENQGPSCNSIELATSDVKAELSADVSTPIPGMSDAVKGKFPLDATERQPSSTVVASATSAATSTADNLNPIWYINKIGLKQSVIDSIAVFRYKKDEGLIEGTECSVCLNEFREDENLRLLPKCSHGFHLTCTDTCTLEPNSIGSSSSNETLVENNIGEDRTNEESRTCPIEDVIQARRSLSLDLTCALDIACETTAEHKHCGSLDTELEQLNYWKGKIGVKRSTGSSSI
ncbi:hypothetical protein F3Y22_tig00110548pilonHSYRG00340 [Hibiscus syriacus]|uniref:RING-type E3 ubiquitin transferase n=1 Tax=Hibiscus syriacus TaxID=106335 RepID=A0A6A3A9J7_HIBSY|nr:hypothetical protein F3Y22_tig00110548pilonHSYRG00340 [Hibiscus syriacus]